MGTTVREFDGTGLMQFKCGFDSLAGDVRGIAVTGKIEPSDSCKETRFNLYKVESTHDLLSSLGVSASFSVQGGYGKGGGKASFAKTTKINRYSVYVLVKVVVKLQTQMITDVEFEQSAAQLLTSESGRKQFRKLYGDEYLAGITSGGELIALVEIQTSNRTDQDITKASLHGEDALGMNKGAAAINNLLEKTGKENSVAVQMFQSGGCDYFVETTPDEIIEKATAFAQSVTNDNAKSYWATFQSYDTVQGPDGAYLIDIRIRQRALDDLTRHLLKHQDSIDSIDYVLAQAVQFEPFDSAALTAKRNELNDVINDLRLSISNCIYDYDDFTAQETLADPVVTLPERLPEKSLEKAIYTVSATTLANSTSNVNADSDSPVFITLIGMHGETKRIRLDEPGRNDFESGKTNKFGPWLDNSIGVLQRIKFELGRRRKDGKFDDWGCKSFTIEVKESDQTTRRYSITRGFWLGDNQGRSLAETIEVKADIE